MRKSVKRFFNGVGKFFGRGGKKVNYFIGKKPFESFFAVLGLLLTLIVLSNFLGAPKQAKKIEVAPVKQVQIYSVGKTPRLIVQAQIEKSGSIHITALTPGVVQNIYKKEGQTFWRGQTLVYLSTNYQGGNAAALQTKLAQLQYNNVLDIGQQQKDLVQKQRDLAAEQNKVSKETDLSKLQKDVANIQLDLQNKTIDLTQQTSLTQLQLAQVTEAMMYPSAPFNGVVEKVSVKVGQAVNPGQELMVISQKVPNDPVTAVVYVSADIASVISTLEPTTLYLKGQTLKEKPFYVTQDAVQGTLYAVYFNIPDKYSNLVTEGGHIRIDLPLDETDTTSVFPFIPIDAIYQTKEQDYVFVAKNGEVETKTVELGEVFGSFVEVKRGLGEEDRIILNRNVIAGDRVTIQ